MQMNRAKDRLFDEEKLYDFLKITASRERLDQTSRALELMKQYHEGQYRKGKDRVPYINHPLTMACHAFALGITEDEILAVILLHDVVEDCGVTAAELDVNEKVREAVWVLTFTQKEGMTRKEAKKQYFARIAENRIAALVKLLDRCNNISTMATGFSREKMLSYIEETEDMVVPLLDKVRESWPEFGRAVFLIEYQMKSIMESLKRIL